MTERTIVDVFWRRVEETPEATAILFKQGDEYQSMNWSEHGSNVEALSAALMSMSVEAGDHVGILSSNRHKWTWADLAILSCGARTIPIYSTLSASEVEFLVDHSEICGIFVANELQLRKLLDRENMLPERLRFVVVFNAETVPEDIETDIEVILWQEFLDRGRQYLKENATGVVERRRCVDPEDLATIVYTSGTTGVPKGAMLLHKNIYAVLEAMSDLIEFNNEDVALSFLPLSHVYERVGGQFLSIYHGLPFAYAESMERVADNIIEVKPSVLNAVPRFYEKVYQRVQAQIKQMPPTRRAFVSWAIGIGKRAMKQKLDGVIEPNIWEELYKAEMRIADRLVYSKIRERLGGKLRMMTSGAAPLSRDVHLFFEAIGMNIVEGYGLTETCAPLSVNKPGDIKLGTVGKPLTGVEVRLAEDGELLVRGPNVFAGYYKNDQATADAFDGDWFRTGDIAEIDEEGYIKITDRKKDIIITAGGKHVAPQSIENLFKGAPLIAHVLVYGDRRKYITALFALNRDALESFATKHKISYESTTELSQHPRVRQELEKLVDEKNKQLTTFQRIKKFIVLDREFSITENELTPTMKIKRKQVTGKFQSLLDGMYDAEDLEAQRV